MRSLTLVPVATSTVCMKRSMVTGNAEKPQVSQRLSACSYLCCVVRKVDFVVDLGAVLLDGVHLHMVWWEFSGLRSKADV